MSIEQELENATRRGTDSYPAGARHRGCREHSADLTQLRRGALRESSWPMPRTARLADRNSDERRGAVKKGPTTRMADEADLIERVLSGRVSNQSLLQRHGLTVSGLYFLWLSRDLEQDHKVVKPGS